jgi:hypothetical protein
MKETAARTGAAVPAAAGTVVSDTMTAGTSIPAGTDPVTDPVTVRTNPRPGVRPGKTEAKAAGVAAKEAVMEAAEAVMVDTRAAVTAAMMPQANVAEATAGEVAVVVGTAAAPAEVATASSSHSLLTSNHSQSSRKNCVSFIIQKNDCDVYVKRKKCIMLYIISV